MRKIVIEEVGYKVGTDVICYKIIFGCQTFIAVGKDDLTKHLIDYISNPDEYEKDWYAKHQGAKQIGLGTVTPIPMDERPGA